MFGSRLPAVLDADALDEAPLPAGGVDLSCGNPTACGLAPTSAELGPTAFDWAAPYRPASLGEPRARDALAAALRDAGQPVHADDLALYASTSEAFAALIKLVAEPGAAVAVGSPGYPLVRHLVELEGLRPLTYASHFDGAAWRLDLADVARAVTDGARAVCVISPNNPTGARVHPEDLAALARLCNPAGVLVVFDEVFAWYGWPPAAATSFVPLGAFARAASLGGLSKAACLPQAKLSWLVLAGGPRFRREARAGLAWIADATLSVGGPVQAALPQVLAAMPAVQARVRARVADSLARVRAWAERPRPGGGPRGAPVAAAAGWYVVVRGLSADVSALEGPLLRAGVRLQPATLFDLSWPDAAVVSLLLPSATLEAGLARLAAVAWGSSPGL